MPASVLAYAPRYIQIRESIRERIAAGIYLPGAKIPSEAELEAEFAVSRITVTNALKDLTQQGLLVRQRGRGTFIRESTGRPVATRLVAIVMRAHGHMFGDLARHLINGFHRRGFYSTVFDAVPIWEGEESTAHLEHFLASGVEAVVVEGMASMPLEQLARLRSCWQRSVIMLRDEGTAGLPGAVRVLSDVRQGARAVMSMLLARGHRRVVHASHFLDDASPRLSGQLIAASQDACREQAACAGIDCRTMIVDDKMPESLAELGVLLRRPDRPTAIFASHDYRAKVIAEVAADAGLRIPGDLELVGFGNTPWCEALPVSLTSVDLRLETLADEVVRAALGESEPGETRWIVPHLVLRQSCPATPRGEPAGKLPEE